MIFFDIEKLREQKHHGEGMLPIAIYTVHHKSSGNILPHHWHNELEFIFLSEGKAVFTVDDEAICARPGECIFVNSGQIHSGFSEVEDCAYISVVFSIDFIVNSFDICRRYFDDTIAGRYKIEAHFKPAIPEHGEIISDLRAIIEELTGKNTAYELSVKSRLLSLFSTIFRKSLYINVPASKKDSFRPKKYHTLKNILGYISQNYNGKLTLADISKSVSLTPQYLCKLFKEMTGTNIVDYINNYRIETAATLLKATNLSITDIALNCGFENISYFNRVFKRETGYTPTEFRLILP
ncbi:AraC family transcriptional regulator [Anaerobacterium chartisolvens]|uniref:AraC family transcriptional regulator n=1 Tax=Anaerobacterium chartisolvens TaxID=1297424 RepID=A0A369AUL9_9FIRM|nr:AraC family transcriptional regulator [Anaerobacterium chartisolvens]RCX11154.1 AraC family transcriptional regulator [Anaerobacterium chartisolvens]